MHLYFYLFMFDSKSADV